MRLRANRNSHRRVLLESGATHHITGGKKSALQSPIRNCIASDPLRKVGVSCEVVRAFADGGSGGGRGWMAYVT